MFGRVTCSSGGYDISTPFNAATIAQCKKSAVESSLLIVKCVRLRRDVASTESRTYKQKARLRAGLGGVTHSVIDLKSIAIFCDVRMGQMVALKILRVTVAVAVGSTSISSVNSQTMYRCGSTFSQTPCGEDAKSHKVFSSGAAESGFQQRVAKIKAECEQWIRRIPQWKDSDSVKLEDGITRGKHELRKVDGAPQIVVPYYASVNAKNSYGAYAGSRPYVCYANQGETRIIDFYKAGDLPN